MTSVPGTVSSARASGRSMNELWSKAKVIRSRITGERGGELDGDEPRGDGPRQAMETGRANAGSSARVATIQGVIAASPGRVAAARERGDAAGARRVRG